MLYLKGDEVLMMALMRKEPDTAPLLRTARSRESADSVLSSTSSTYLQSGTAMAQILFINGTKKKQIPRGTERYCA